MIGRAPMGWHGGCGEMSGGVEIAFYFHVVCASPPSLCAAWRRAIKNKLTQKRAGVSWWSCPGPRMTKGTRKIASKNSQEADERESPSLLNRPYSRCLACWQNCWPGAVRVWRLRARARWVRKGGGLPGLAVSKAQRRGASSVRVLSLFLCSRCR